MDNDFLGYAQYRQEVEDIIDTCVNQYHSTGKTNFSFETVNDLNDNDYDYIQREIQKRI